MPSAQSHKQTARVVPLVCRSWWCPHDAKDHQARYTGFVHLRSQARNHVRQQVVVVFVDVGVEFVIRGYKSMAEHTHYTVQRRL